MDIIQINCLMHKSARIIYMFSFAGIVIWDMLQEISLNANIILGIFFKKPVTGLCFELNLNSSDLALPKYNIYHRTSRNIYLSKFCLFWFYILVICIKVSISFRSGHCKTFTVSCIMEQQDHQISPDNFQYKYTLFIGNHVKVT